MSVTVPGSVLDRVQAFTRSRGQPDVFVPIEDTASCRLLLDEMAAIAFEHGGDDMTIIVDANTALEYSGIRSAHRKATHTYVFGEPPEAWVDSEDLTVCSFYGTVTADDRFLVAISSTVNLALVVTQHRQPQGTEFYSRGGWTGARELVRYISETLLASSDVTLPSNLPEALSPEATEVSQGTSMRLMSLLSRRYLSRERTIALDKSDLSSVLEILKAISAERRAHDILYTFVEKIAEVISIDRCSVVRVWGGENKGHVLASHEDESVHDLVIELDKYPEITDSMSKQGKVVINDVVKSALLKKHAAALEKAGITAIMVIPVVLFDENVGSFFLRAARRGGTSRRVKSVSARSSLRPQPTPSNVHTSSRAFSAPINDWNTWPLQTASPTCTTTAIFAIDWKRNLIVASATVFR